MLGGLVEMQSRRLGSQITAVKFSLGRPPTRRDRAGKNLAARSGNTLCRETVELSRYAGKVGTHYR